MLWQGDDFPHPGDPELQALSSHPHHFQFRRPDGSWEFLESSFRGQIEAEIPLVLLKLSEFLA